MNNQERTSRNRNRSRSQTRRNNNKRAAGPDVWKAGGELPPIEPITIPSDVSALLRSLGDPPMLDGSAAGHYFATVVERSAAIAAALALSAGLLADRPD